MLFVGPPAVARRRVSAKIVRDKNTDNGEYRFQSISPDKLKKIIIDLDCNKTNLNGSIPDNVLKGKCDNFIPYLTEIINESFQTGNYPIELKRSTGFSFRPCTFQIFHK